MAVLRRKRLIFLRIFREREKFELAFCSAWLLTSAVFIKTKPEREETETAAAV